MYRIDDEEWWGIIFSLKEQCYFNTCHVEDMSDVNVMIQYISVLFYSVFEKKSIKNNSCWTIGCSSHLHYCCISRRERCQWAMLAGLRAMPDWVSGRQTPESSQPSEHRATICLGLGLTWRTTFPLSSHSQTGLTGLAANGFRPWKGLENALSDIRYKLYHITDIF